MGLLYNGTLAIYIISDMNFIGRQIAISFHEV
jgi:hypothetical protein